METLKTGAEELTEKVSQLESRLDIKYSELQLALDLMKIDIQNPSNAPDRVI